MKISLITVCYNSATTLEKTILSVAGQTYANIEYIIVDGNSNDGTLGIIQKHEDKIITTGNSFFFSTIVFILTVLWCLSNCERSAFTIQLDAL